MELHLAIPTQGALRNWEQVGRMTDFVASRGVFDRKSLDTYAAEWGLRLSPLIQVSRFEDGQMFLHDGHHRVYSIWKGGRLVLIECEFEVTDWTYAQYLEVNASQGWYTPFDPRSEVRLPDFRSWKMEVEAYLDRRSKDNSFSAEEFAAYVRSNRNRYADDRRVSHIRDLCINDKNLYQQMLRRV